jgi:hypothetical protein
MMKALLLLSACRVRDKRQADPTPLSLVPAAVPPLDAGLGRATIRLGHVQNFELNYRFQVT